MCHGTYRILYQFSALSSYEDGMFPGASQSRLDLTSSFFVDSTLCCSRRVNTPLADGKLTTLHLRLSLAETLSESLWSLRTFSM